MNWITCWTACKNKTEKGVSYKTYTIQRISGTPDWPNVPPLEVDQHLWLPSDAIAMTVQICYKCGDLTPQEHYLSWNPVDHPTPDFHRSCDFSKMILE